MLPSQLQWVNGSMRLRFGWMPGLPLLCIGLTADPNIVATSSASRRSRRVQLAFGMVWQFQHGPSARDAHAMGHVWREARIRFWTATIHAPCITRPPRTKAYLSCAARSSNCTPAAARFSSQSCILHVARLAEHRADRRVLQARCSHGDVRAHY